MPPKSATQESMRGTLPPRLPPRWPPALSFEQVACNSWGASSTSAGESCALGVLFILLGLALAAFAIQTTGPGGTVVADGHPVGASNPSPAAALLQVVYAAPLRPASAATGRQLSGARGQC